MDDNELGEDVLLVPRDLRVAGLDAGGGEANLVVVSFALPAPTLPDVLTATEREIASAILDGASDKEIADQRGTSRKTVANQIAAVFRKLEVNSRAELVRLLVED